MKKHISVISFLFIGFACVAEPVKSMLGSDGIEFNSDEWMPTAADYVQEGLVAMWDGIENIGYGQHDDDATTWVDLTGNGYNLPCAAGSVYENAVRYSSSYQVTYDSSPIDGHAMTLQAVIDRSETTGNFCILGFGYASLRVFVGGMTSYGCRFGGRNYSWGRIDGIRNSITMARGESILYFDLYDGEKFVTTLNAFPGEGADVEQPKLNINGENAYGNYRNVFSANCIRLYNRELTEKEIKYNYLIDKMRFGL